MKRYRELVSVITFLSFTVMSCTSSTRVARTWTDETLDIRPMSSITVAAGMLDASLDLFFEKQWLDQLEAVGMEAVPAGIRIPDDDRREPDQGFIDELLEQSDTETVLISSFAMATEKDVFIPVPLLTDIGYDPDVPRRRIRSTGFTAVDTYFYYKTSLYDTTSRRMIWSLLTKTWNPDSPEQIMEEVVRTTLKEMQNQGIIRPTRSDD